MTVDPVELERLSKAATQGVWEHEFRGGHTSQGEVTCGKHSVITVNGGNFAQWRDAPDDGEAEFKANGDFVCALVNAYRTGQLVPAQPSGDASGGGSGLVVGEAMSKTLHNALIASCDSVLPPIPSGDEVEAVAVPRKLTPEMETAGMLASEDYFIMDDITLTGLRKFYEAAIAARAALGEKP